MNNTMYLKGTQIECEAYNQEVIDRENFTASTTGYATVNAHQNGVDFAILKHDQHESEMETIDEIPKDWFKDLEL
jgi:hypothetical protein